jgi:RimJ/RimL family protein N-acetyltransferase
MLSQEDKDYFRTLRNDPDAVRFSWSKREIRVDEHNRWWEGTQDALFIAEASFSKTLGATRRVGTLRLTELDESTCEVHLAVAREERGKGLSTRMLKESLELADGLGYTRIVARVDTPNTASLRAFFGAGYRITSPGTVLLERGLEDV